MILFVGSQDVGYMVSQVSQEEVKYTGTISTVDEIENELFKMPYSKVIINLGQLLDSPVKLQAEIRKLWHAYGKPIIFYAIGFSEQSDIIRRLIEDGFAFFVLSSFPGHQREELMKCLRMEPTVQPITGEEITVDLSKTDVGKEIEKKVLTIGVTGCCKRIGTTTQAIQICKYLQLKGHNPCYVAYDEPDIQDWAEIYDRQENDDDEEYSRITLFNLDMYTDPLKLPLIRALDYDAIVYDFNCISDSDFQMLPFLQNDIRIVVGGISPKEMVGMQAAYNTVLSSGTYFLFSFVPEENHKDVLDMQAQLAPQTGFAPYTPDPFTYTSKATAFFDKIIKASTLKKPKKTGLFKRKKGGDK